MSDAIQLMMNTQSACQGPGQGQGDSGSEGFAQLFEQQMQVRAQPATSARTPAPAPASQVSGVQPAPAEKPSSRETERLEDDARPDPAPADPAKLVLKAASTATATTPMTAAPLSAPAPAAPVLSASAQALTLSSEAEQAPEAPVSVAPVSAASPVPAVQAVASTQIPLQAAQLVQAEAPVVEEGEAFPAHAASLTSVSATESLDLTDASATASQTPLPVQAMDPAVLALVQALASPGLMGALTPAASAAVSGAAMPVATSDGALAGVGGAAPASAGSPASAEASGAPAPRPSQAEMIERLAVTAKLLNSARGEKVLVLKLQPPQLGHVRIQMMVQDGVLHATVQTESEAARQAVLQNLDHLKASLGEQGLQLGRFDVQADGDAGARLAAGQGGGRQRRSPEERAMDELMASPAAEAPRRMQEGADDAPVMSDALAVDLLA